VTVVEVGFITGAVIVFGAVAAKLFNKLQARSNKLQPIDENRLCPTQHIWKQVSFLSEEEYLQHQESGFQNVMPETHYCNECGLVSGTDLMFKAGYLTMLRDKQIEMEAAIQKEQDILDLEKDFYEKAIASAGYQTDAERNSFTEGFGAYMTFVEALPTLLLLHQQKRAKAELDKLN
jgi:hypothetical protein